MVIGLSVRFILLFFNFWVYLLGILSDKLICLVKGLVKSLYKSGFVLR